MNNNDVIEKITTYYGYTYIIPCVCTFGIICNIVNLSVLASRRLKESPYTYLTALAYVDLLTLLFTLTTTFSRGAWSQKSNNAHTEYYLKRFERLFFLPSANASDQRRPEVALADGARALGIPRFQEAQRVAQQPRQRGLPGQ